MLSFADGLAIFPAEYFEVFPAEGELLVEVKFKSGMRKIATRHASFKDVSNVIQLLEHQIEGCTCMTFDDFPMDVTEMRIDLSHKRVCLKVNDL